MCAEKRGPEITQRRQVEIERKNELFVVPFDLHNDLIKSFFESRGYQSDEVEAVLENAIAAANLGIHTHNGLKAIHLELGFRDKEAIVPGAQIEKLESSFAAVHKWDAHRKPGQAVAYEAVNDAIDIARKYGQGTVVVDNVFHYCYGGDYALKAAEQGLIGFTSCTAGRAEVVPHGGKTPTIGTNPYSWAFPTRKAVGYDMLLDFASSSVAFGRVTTAKREGQPLPPDAAVDSEGNITMDPKKAVALLPFGGHKGSGLSVLTELWGAYIGGSKPTERGQGQSGEPDRKNTSCFLFQVIHPDAIGCSFEGGRSQPENVARIISDIVGHGNENLIRLPGQRAGTHKDAVRKAEGFLFTQAEMEEFNKISRELGLPLWELSNLLKTR